MTYESPDRGETVFHRMAGSLQRTLVSKSPTALRYDRWRDWYNIIAAAENDPAIEEVVAKAEAMYAAQK